VFKLPLILYFPKNVEVKFTFSIGAQALPEGVKATGQRVYTQIRAKIPDWVIEVVKESIMGVLSHAITALVVL